MNNTKKELTCIVCPRGCTLVTLMENGEVSVSGNMCPRGKTYAINERTNPQRTVTTTMRTSDGGVVAVKTLGTIEKGKMLECMKIINATVAPLPIRIGDVIIENVFGTDVVATQNKD